MGDPHHIPSPQAHNPDKNEILKKLAFLSRGKPPTSETIPAAKIARTSPMIVILFMFVFLEMSIQQ